MDDLVLNSSHTKEMAHRIIDDLWDKHKYLRVTIKTGKQRSKQQNKALHLYLRMLSEALNDRGIDMKRYVEDGIDIPWDKEGKMAKEHIWRVVQEAITGCESTTQPEKHEYTLIYETINRKTATDFGISLPWPSKKEDEDK